MKIKLHWQILFGLIIGSVIGYIARINQLENIILHYIAPIGTLFMRSLQMIIVPLIISSIISSITSIRAGNNLGTLSLKTTLYYLSTSFLAILTGLTIVNIFKPGIGAKIDLGPFPSTINTHIEIGRAHV